MPQPLTNHDTDDPASDLKLPRHKATPRRSDRNEWLAADRRERNKIVVAVVVVLLLLGAGIWLLTHGFRE